MSAEHEQGGTAATDAEAAAVLSILLAPGVGDAVRALRAYGDSRVAEFAAWQPRAAPVVANGGVRIHSDGSACGGEYGPDIDVRGPDAALMAAAPDMYEALREYLAGVDTPRIPSWESWEWSIAILVRMRKAVAKAEGRSAAESRPPEKP